MSDYQEVPKVEIDGPNRTYWVEVSENNRKAGLIELQVNEPYVHRESGELRYGRSNVRIPVGEALPILEQMVEAYSESTGKTYKIVEE